MSTVSSANDSISSLDHIPVYLMLGINTLAVIILAFRYFRTKLLDYVALAVAVLGYGNSFMVFMQGTGDRGDFSTVLALFVSAFAFLTLGQVVFDVVTVRLLGSWLNSMEGSARVDDAKRSKARRIANVLMFAYPIAGAAYVITFSVMLLVPTSRGVMGWLAIVAGFFYFLLSIVQFIVCIWLWLGVRSGQMDESYLSKRNQMIRLVFLALFSDSALYYRVGNVFSLWWVVRLVVVLWPGALAGYQEPLKSADIQKVKSVA